MMKALTKFNQTYSNSPIVMLIKLTIFKNFKRTSLKYIRSYVKFKEQV